MPQLFDTTSALNFGPAPVEDEFQATLLAPQADDALPTVTMPVAIWPTPKALPPRGFTIESGSKVLGKEPHRATRCGSVKASWFRPYSPVGRIQTLQFLFQRGAESIVLLKAEPMRRERECGKFRVREPARGVDGTR